MGARQPADSHRIGAAGRLVQGQSGHARNPGGEGRQRKGEEGGYLVSGELELRIDGQEILLQAGDSFQLPAAGRHWCRNPGKVETQVVWVFGNAHF